MQVKRLNYIGSKFKLLDWIDENIRSATGWNNFQDKKIADLFSGTGIVSHHFRTKGATVFANDAELYSYIITHAFNCSVYTPKCKEFIEAEIGETVGFITEKYSPYNGNERMFFTVENASKIDDTRLRIERHKHELTADEYMFILASLLISADAVSNVPAVYGCYLKNFKAKALATFRLTPCHTNEIAANAGSATVNLDVLSDTLLNAVAVDAVYLDPPYNNRQYSKNYFPLNMIALTPSQQAELPPLKGKTGIPVDCFLSPFCKPTKAVEEAFDTLVRRLNTRWIFLSYNSESTVSKEKMVSILEKYGDVTVVERDYKRFKSFNYNTDCPIKEFLFCLRKTLP